MATFAGRVLRRRQVQRALLARRDGGTGPLGRWRVGVAVLTAALACPASAAATFRGRDGAILGVDSSPASVDLPAARTGAPVARPADCGANATSYDAWSVWPNGSHRRHVGAYSAGLFSPSGKRLALASPDECGAITLYLARADGSHAKVISGENLDGWLPHDQLIVDEHIGDPTTATRFFDAISGSTLMTIQGNQSGTWAVSCAGRVAYSRDLTSGGTELDVFTRMARRGSSNKHGVAREPLLRTSDAYYVGNVLWSPDGRSLLIERVQRLPPPTPDFSDLWLATLSGGWRPEPLHPGGSRGSDSLDNPSSEGQSLGNWSPDGRRVLFYRTPARGRTEAIVANADGSHAHVVYRGSNTALWSPDSASLAFANGTIIDSRTGSVRRRHAFSFNQVVDWQPWPGTSARTPCADPGTVSSRPPTFTG
jgi:WD40-like Beta Propeller Repeat